MKKETPSLSNSSAAKLGPAGADLHSDWQRVIRRRSFLSGLGLAGAAVPAASILATKGKAASDRLTPGDVSILKFLAAAELIETDLWQQYNELGGVKGGNPAYQAALSNLDGDMTQYISDNTDDEMSHAAFLNAYLESKGEQRVDLKRFEILPGSQATGAGSKRRLTNLQQLHVDTSFYTRYRSARNPDFGDSFPQAVEIGNQPAIPVSDSDTPLGTTIPSVSGQTPGTSFKGAAARMQAIANTAAFHFGYIEQGGASLYAIMTGKCTSLEVLRIVVSIGGVEVDHFGLWHDKMGNAVSQPLAGVTDPETGLTFPDLNKPPFGGATLQTNLILPEPCEFIAPHLPVCSVIRPSLTRFGGAVATIKSFMADQLFAGQTPDFFEHVMGLAVAADAVERDLQS